MTRTVDFIFDCASPNAYLVHHVIPGLLERTGARLNVIPCLLGGIFKATGNQAPMTAFGHIKNKPDYERTEFRRFIEKHQLTNFKFNPHFPVNTLLAMRGAVFAQTEGFLDSYVETILRLMWEQEAKLDNPEVLCEGLKDAGLDADAIVKATQDPQIKATLIANTESAIARGAFGIPTFFVGDEMFFGKERLTQIEELLEGTST